MQSVLKICDIARCLLFVAENRLTNRFYFIFRFSLKKTEEICFLQLSLSYTSLSCKSHSFVRPIGIVSSRILLHGVIRKIIFSCTSLSVLRPNFWVPTWTYNRDSTVLRCIFARWKKTVLFFIFFSLYFGFILQYVYVQLWGRSFRPRKFMISSYNATCEFTFDLGFTCTVVF